MAATAVATAVAEKKKRISPRYTHDVRQKTSGKSFGRSVRSGFHLVACAMMGLVIHFHDEH